jgi:hypothetical protein
MSDSVQKKKGAAMLNWLLTTDANRIENVNNKMLIMQELVRRNNVLEQKLDGMRGELLEIRRHLKIEP